MKKIEVRLKEEDESEYGWAYIKSYLSNDEGKRRPINQALEQIFREHEMYKAIAQNIGSMHQDLSNQLEKVQKEVHFTLLRSGDAEKSARTLLHLWNSYNYDNNVTSYLPMNELVTPPVEKALNEVGQYYNELAKKKRSKQEQLTNDPDSSVASEVTKTVPGNKAPLNDFSNNSKALFNSWEND
ncbi:hypothetical protein ACQKTA_13430 (plasmid) [Enterococcus sp. 22-H-5-01]|uniref:hypothetical protein n=1 Tax=Enterococcus sp. 22-H-5-01 TaxID=3418555 RepID=UPI003D02200F